MERNGSHPRSGTLIWTTNQYYGQVYNLQVQEYKGKKYLTFWAGNDSVGGHGVGKYYMVCSQSARRASEAPH